MKHRPIIFSTPMVKAILDGRKTQTRRVMNPQPVLGKPWKDWIVDPDVMDLPTAYCPYGIKQDRLWVKETWAWIDNSEFDFDAESYVEYRADNPGAKYPGEWPEEEARGNPEAPKWKSSIHMPKKHARIWLEITGVRVERLQDISDEDVLHEGFRMDNVSIFRLGYKGAFAELWDSINKKKHPWSSNDWVWVLEFRKVTP